MAQLELRQRLISISAHHMYMRTYVAPVASNTLKLNQLGSGMSSAMCVHRDDTWAGGVRDMQAVFSLTMVVRVCTALLKSQGCSISPWTVRTIMFLLPKSLRQHFCPESLFRRHRHREAFRRRC